MIPFAKHNFMHHKYITAKIHNGNIYSTVAQTTTERIINAIVVASSGYMRGGMRQFDYNHKVDKLVSTYIISIYTKCKHHVLSMQWQLHCNYIINLNCNFQIHNIYITCYYIENTWRLHRDYIEITYAPAAVIGWYCADRRLLRAAKRCGA